MTRTRTERPEEFFPGRLLLHSKEPFNAEPPLSELVEHEHTPEELMYCRNHCSVPPFSEDSFTVNIDGQVQKELEFTIKELADMFPRKSVVAALQCAGNRRNTMSEMKDVEGILWGDGAIANARWTGVALRDILVHTGLSKDFDTTDKHVCFASYAEVCENDDWYGSSIPLDKAMDPNGDVLLAFEMNDKPLSIAHGHPLRVVIPGYCGARWVKWVQRITVSREESPNFYQRNDYKILPSNIEMHEQAKQAFYTSPALQELWLNSAIAAAFVANDGKLHVKGYAVPSARAPISKIEVSIDRGKSWNETLVTYSEGRWTWVLWEAFIDVTGEQEGLDVTNTSKQGLNDGECAEDGKRVAWCRAWDANDEVQTQLGTTPWNLRGVAYNGYGRSTW